MGRIPGHLGRPGRLATAVIGGYLEANGWTTAETCGVFLERKILPKVSLIAKGNVFVFDFAISEDIYCLFPSAYFLLSASGDWRNNAPRRLQQPSARQGTPARRGFLAAPLRFWDKPTTTTQWHASHAVHVRLSLVSLKNRRSTWHWEWFQDTSAELPEIGCNINHEVPFASL